MSHRHLAVTSVLVALLTATVLMADEPGAYRGHRLGVSTADVLERLGEDPGDLQTLHTRPALLQELSWRPPYSSGREGAAPESVARIVFGFIDDQLFKMAIDYDRARTEGLTPDDMLASLTAAYGPRSTGRGTAPRGSVDSLDSATILATWRQGDTAVTLQQSMYGGGFRLIVVSKPMEARALGAQAAAAALEAREAPAREAARAKAQADADRAAAEKTRAANKATFKP